jgi:RNA-binding motif X-linked protein 2
MKSIQRLNEREVQTGLVERGSWHDQYKDSSYIFIGNLARDLTEGDIRSVFSQYANSKRFLYLLCRYGEVVDINLAKEKDSNSSRGFAFLSYQDQRSTVLAVDNFNGTRLAGRDIRVDHVLNYKSPEEMELAKTRKQHERTKYADMVTEELFKSAAGDLMTIPSEEAFPENNLDEDELPMDTEATRRSKRPRTLAEIELREKFKSGKLSEEEFQKEKRKLKKSLR